MNTYLGKISFNNKYVNFKPLYEYINGDFRELEYAERQALLPESQTGMIYFYSTTPTFDVSSEFSDEEFVLFEFDTHELEDHTSRATGERNRTGYKINVSLLPPERFRRLPEVDYFYLVKSDCIDGDYKTNPALVITDNYVTAGMKVMLEVSGDENILIGPLDVNWREYDRQCIVKTDYLASEKYFIWGYNYPDGFYPHIRELGSYDNSIEYVRVSDDICTKTALDVITPELLIKHFQTAVGVDGFEDGKLDFSDMEAVIERYRSSLITGNSIPTEVREQRLETITSLLTSEENLNNTFSFIGETIGAFLLKYQANDGYSNLIEQIANKPDFIKDKLPKFANICNQISEKESELDRLTQEIEDLKSAISEQKAQEATAVFVEERQSEIQQLTDRIETLKIEIDTHLNTLQAINHVSELQARTEYLSEEIGHKEWRERELSKSIQTIESRIDTIFANSADKAMQFAFDGMLANKMLQKAAEWENQQSCKNYEFVVEETHHLPISNRQDSALLDYLVSSIQKYRPSYDKNAIINILICISQGFLTVFSGEPGTGKTSICKIVSHVMGLNIPDKKISSADGIKKSRFINVSVERGWTTKRDFIGYYNPLTKVFDQANREVFDGLNVLDIEAKKDYNSIPFFILLDEANLSPMEYYWADYMNVCDDLDQNSSVNLGGNYCFRVPSHLRFLATINNDHTTESLSPRLIDRAWIIRLPKTKPGTTTPLVLNTEESELVSWTAFTSIFGSSLLSDEPMAEDASKIYDTLVSKLRDAKITVSNRVDNAIRRYCQVAQKLFEKDVNDYTPPSIVALDYAVAQKILPRINGSGEKFGESLKQILKIFVEKNLRYSAEILSEIIQKGDDMMSYYQFFAKSEN